MSTTSRINGLQQIEAALRTLEAYGYNTLPLWSEHHEWLAASEARLPQAHDFTWATQHQPSSIEDHVGQGGFEVLTAARCFSGRQFRLTPGQREVLRSRHGLTPTQEVVVREVSVFKGTNVINQFTLCSTEHIDIRRRRHVLTEVVINPASAFFSAASALDKEREAEEVEADEVRIKEGKAPKNPRSLAMQYFE